MRSYHGKAICSGAALGRLCCYFHTDRAIDAERDFCPSDEIGKLSDAIEEAASDLKRQYEQALRTLGEEDAAIFSVHLTMLEDDELREVAEDLVRVGHSAAYAVTEAGKRISEQLVSMEDDYIRERAIDVLDVSSRVCNCLTGVDEGLPELTEAVILVCDDLTPGEVVRLDREKVLAIVLADGSESAHTAILLRNMSIPTLIRTGIRADEVEEGVEGAVETAYGIFTLDPDDATAKRCRYAMEEASRDRLALREWIGKPTKTADGRSVKLYCNIGSADELGLVKENDGSGIGLYRSEFLYLESDTLPSEELQFEEYRRLAECSLPVIIRTMDVGADKQVSYLGLAREDNPALGYRSVRICRDRPEILRTQLRAIYRAALYGELSIMFPMITSVDEVKWVKQIAGEAAASLAEEGIDYKADLPLGIMIETPAAAIIADLLASEVDFFSVGTNDLTQYTLAVDRQNELVSHLYSTAHTALLRMIKYVADAAHKAGKWVGICGEAARDASLIPFFLAIGIDELSISPTYILPLRRSIAEIDTGAVDLDEMLSEKEKGASK